MKAFGVSQITDLSYPSGRAASRDLADIAANPLASPQLGLQKLGPPMTITADPCNPRNNKEAFEAGLPAARFSHLLQHGQRLFELFLLGMGRDDAVIRGGVGGAVRGLHGCEHLKDALHTINGSGVSDHSAAIRC
jgi:hypothetical protein